MKFEPQQIALVTHAANAALRSVLREPPGLSWADAASSAVSGVEDAIEHPEQTHEQSHENWLAFKKAAGWSNGDVLDPVAKKHPWLVPYSELPEEQRRKDALFTAIVRALTEPIS